MGRLRIVIPLVICLLGGLLLPAARPFDFAALPPSQSGGVTPSDLILAMNTLRVSMGNEALIVDPIVMSVAQATADTMAAYEMSWHIGDVRGRIAFTVPNSRRCLRS